MHSDTNTTKQKQRVRQLRWAVIFLPVLTTIGAFNIQKIVMGDGTWVTGISLTLDVGLAITNFLTLWKATNEGR